MTCRRGVGGDGEVVEVLAEHAGGRGDEGIGPPEIADLEEMARLDAHERCPGEQRTDEQPEEDPEGSPPRRRVRGRRKLPTEDQKQGERQHGQRRGDGSSWEFPLGHVEDQEEGEQDDGRPPATGLAPLDGAGHEQQEEAGEDGEGDHIALDGTGQVGGNFWHPVAPGADDGGGDVGQRGEVEQVSDPSRHLRRAEEAPDGPLGGARFTRRRGGHGGRTQRFGRPQGRYAAGLRRRHAGPAVPSACPSLCPGFLVDGALGLLRSQSARNGGRERRLAFGLDAGPPGPCGLRGI